MIQLLLAVSLASSNATPTDAIAAYDRAIATSSAEALGRAFQPSAIMYCTDGAASTATYQVQWKGRLAGAAPPSPSMTQVEWIDAGGTSAVARLRSIRGAKTFIDYLLLARLDQSWRIVGKLCQSNVGERPSAPADIDAVIDLKLAADRAWDDAGLQASLDPRALVMTVEGGEFVAASVAEWQARYRDRRTTSTGNVFDVTSRQVDIRGDIGVARWSFRSAQGEWTDRALLMRTPEGWRMMALLFTKEAPIEDR
jgi:hypothetical protein